MNEAIRGEFPALADGGTIYLDNPAGTQIPRMVSEAVRATMERAASNRGGYFAASGRAENAYEAAHRKIAMLFGTERDSEVVIGQSMTSLTYLVSRCIGERIAPGDEIVVTRMDHEGNVAPWLQMAEERGAEVKWLDFSRDSWSITPEALNAALSERTRLVALSYASNLTGTVNDIAELVAAARQAGAIAYVDAVQYAPHRLLDVAAIGADAVVCSAYKFYGPHLGALWMREALMESLPAFQVRCGPSHGSGRFEHGTAQAELLAGLAAAVDYLARLGDGAASASRAALDKSYAAIRAHEDALTRQLLSGLQAIPGTRIVGLAQTNSLDRRVPTVSGLFDGVAPPRMAEALAQRNICVWSGHNYAWETVRALDLPEDEGVVRFGLAHYNTPEEVDLVLQAVEDAARRLRS